MGRVFLGQSILTHLGQKKISGMPKIRDRPDRVGSGQTNLGQVRHSRAGPKQTWTRVGKLGQVRSNGTVLKETGF